MTSAIFSYDSAIFLLIFFFYRFSLFKKWEFLWCNDISSHYRKNLVNLRKYSDHSAFFVVIDFAFLYNESARKTSMTTFKIIVTNLGGLTSRSSAELVGEANKYHCNVIWSLSWMFSPWLQSIKVQFSPSSAKARMKIKRS